MNLTKLFNFKYFKENCKRVQGLLLLLIISLPLLTFLFVGIGLDNKGRIDYIDFDSIIMINAIELYIIPIILSFVLIGYVYKKAAVDLINSMPINRKTIFLTNTIGGIFFIILMQLLTALGLILINVISPGIAIELMTIIDSFILMTMAYIFVFTASNLAMTISGTFITQIVVTCLIIFLLPFMGFVLNHFEVIDMIKLTDGESIVKQSAEDLTSNTATTPTYFVEMAVGIADSRFVTGNIYNNTVIVKELCYTVIYIGLGIFFFNKRKMENNIESFNNDKIHIFIKGLIIFPFVYIINYINLYGSRTSISISLFIFIIFIYYIYDFIVKKKINIVKSTIGLILIMVILNGSFYILNSFSGIANKKIKEIDIADVTEYSISYNKDIANSYYINNREILSMIVDASKKFYKYNETAEANVLKEMEEKSSNVTLNDEDIQALSLSDIRFSFKTNNDKMHDIILTLPTEDLNKIMDLVNAKTDYLENYKKEMLSNGRILVDGYCLEPELENKINSLITEKINTFSNEELMTKLENISWNYGSNVIIYKNVYINHKVVTYYFSDSFSNEILTEFSAYNNENTIKLLKNIQNEEDVYVSYNLIGDLRKNVADNEMFYGSYDNTSNEVENFILNDEHTLDTTKEYYVFQIYSSKDGKSNYYYTNNIDKVNELSKKEAEIRYSYEKANVDEEVYYGM